MAVEIGEAFVRVGADTSRARADLLALRGTTARTATGISSNLRSIGVGLSKLGISMQSFGRSMTTYVTLPLLGMGTAATKAAMDFNRTFTQISTLAGRVGTSMDEAKEKVLAMAHATAIAPQDLAQGLYFVASSGARASQVFDILRAAAKGAAAGMGEVQTLASLLTSATNAYADTNLRAATAMDIFVEAVRLGKAEPAELATTLGTVIPVAAQMGVSLQDVGAALATATNLGVPLARAVTGLRYLLASLQRPTTTAVGVLKDYGLTVEQINATLSQPQGLLRAMELLADTFDITTLKGRQAFQTVVGGARGAIVANTLIGGSAEQAARNFDLMQRAARGASGGLKEVFDEVRRTPEFKLQQAMSDLRAAMIDLGNTIIPILVKDVLPVLRDLLRTFADLDDDTKRRIVLLAGGLAALGPALLGLGMGLRAIASGAKGIAILAALLRLGAAGGAGGAGGGAAAAGAGATGLLAAKLAGLAGTAKLAAFGAVATGVIADIASAVEDFRATNQELAEQTGLTAQQIEMIRRQVDRTAVDWNPFTSQADKVREAGERYRAVLEDMLEAGVPLAKAQEILNRRFDEAVGAIGGITGSLPTFEARLRGTGDLTKVFVRDIERFATGAERVANAIPALVGELFALGRGFTSADARAINTALAKGDLREAVRLLLAEVQKLPRERLLEIKANVDHRVWEVLRDLMWLDRHRKFTIEILENRRQTTREGGRVKGGVTGTGIMSGLGASSWQGSVGQQAREWMRARREIEAASQSVAEYGRGVSRASATVRGLAEDVRKIPRITVRASTSPAETAIRSFMARMRALTNEGLTVPISAAIRNAAGGIVAGQSGFITQGPVLLVGEGRYRTFAGRGAEAVIPLDERGIAILAEALTRAMGRGGRQVIVQIAGKVERPEDIHREMLWFERSRGW